MSETPPIFHNDVTNKEEYLFEPTWEAHDTTATFPEIGEATVLYLAKDSNLLYRWSGSAYVQVGSTSKIPVNDEFLVTSRNGNGQILTGDYKLAGTTVGTWTLTYDGPNDANGNPQCSLAVLTAPDATVLETQTIAYDGSNLFLSSTIS